MKQVLRIAPLMTMAFCVCMFIHVRAQNVAINADSSMPNVNAILDVKSFNKGILIPRTSTTSRTLIPNTKGLLVYDTTTNSFWYNTGAGWVNMQSASAWTLTGNKSTKDTLNFLGTTDSTTLNIRVNNKTGGRIDPKNNNTFLGYKAGMSDSGGNNNVIIGAIASPGYKTANNVTAVGDSALYTNVTGTFNTAIGARADVTSGNLTNTTALGYGAKVSASNTVVIGNSAVTDVQTAGVVNSAGLLSGSSPGAAIDPSAIIEGRSTTKGFLPPRLTVQQIFALQTPATGLLVFNTTRNKAAYFDGLTWRFFNDSELTAPGVLPNATANCTYTNACTIVACNPGYSDCDGIASNGCEVNLVSSPGNCGACGLNAASLPNVLSANCIAGKLVITACKAGYSDCDGAASNGCEVNINTDPNNCGACGKPVTGLPNVAVASCTAGVVSIISCNPGFADCDKVVSNGCEVNVMTNANNCGTCGASGAGLPNVISTLCTAGNLVITACAAGFADCDGVATNGCETNLNTSAYNCGLCGVSGAGLPHVAAASCVSGKLVIITCNAGFSDCDGNVSNGCEVNLTTSINNCGLCGVNGTNLPNVASASCVSGKLVILSCNPGYSDCDGNVSNGCEVNLKTNTYNCSACGVACPVGKTCVNGVCQ